MSKKIPLQFYLNRLAHNQFKVICVLRGQHMTDVLIEIVTNFIEKESINDMLEDMKGENSNG